MAREYFRILRLRNCNNRLIRVRVNVISLDEFNNGVKVLIVLKVETAGQPFSI